MRDINTIYREEVDSSNKEYTKSVGDSVTTLGEDLRKGMEIIRLGMEKFSNDITLAAQKHLERVSASEVSWIACAERKMAQFQGINQLQISDGESSKNETPPKLPVAPAFPPGDEDPIPSFLTKPKQLTD